MVIILKDESLEAEDFVGTDDEAREWFSEHWMRLHNGHGFHSYPVRMELIRMGEEDVETAFVASYEIAQAAGRGMTYPSLGRGSTGGCGYEASKEPRHGGFGPRSQ
jgi:hypothetical protein